MVGRTHFDMTRQVAMWSARTEQTDRRTLNVAVYVETVPMSYSEVLRLWQHDADFRSFFIGLLADAPFSAFRWETPPITAALVDRPFEFVLLDSPGLGRNPNGRSTSAAVIG